MSSLALTAEQQAAVDVDGHVLVTGAAGTGKTATLVARYLSLLDRHRASALLVVSRNRDAAARFRDAVLPHLAGGLDSLPITTIHGVAFDLVSRHLGPVDLLTGAEQREAVRAVLAADAPERWPSLGHLLGRERFVGEVGAAVVDLQASVVSPDTVKARAEAPGMLDRWEELLAFAGRYQAALDETHRIDQAGLLVAAAELLRRREVREAEAGRFAHLLVDDHEAAVPAAQEIVEALAGLGACLAVAANPDAAMTNSGADPECLIGLAARTGATAVRLTRPFRVPPGEASLLACGHPAVEPEAVARLLLDARAEGVAWRDMAVLTRRPGGRARGIVRALARHGIPVEHAAPPAGDDAVVKALVDTLRWVDGDRTAFDRVLASPVTGLQPAEVRTIRRQAADEGIRVEDHPRLAALTELGRDLRQRVATDSPADLAFEVWQHALGYLVDDSPADSTAPAADDRALDAVVTFIDGLRQRAERRPGERLADFLAGGGAEVSPPDPWRVTAALGPEAVTVTTITAAAGREWHTVVVAGCVEGELPRVRAQPRLFDRALLLHDRLPSAPERLRRALADERHLFEIARSRATGRLVGCAAPEPGVLLSRFVEGWPLLATDLPLAPGPAALSRAATVNDTPVHPAANLLLSASQLQTYDDCPLRYSYEYVLGARDDPGVHADLGSLVHEVLATFLDPAQPPVVPRTHDGLLALGEKLWRDDIARYRPQVEEARRDYFAMLESWWQAEGGQIEGWAEASEAAPPASQVLAVEHRFDVDVGRHRVRGAIDRIDRADDGEGIRIVDYKTGKVEPVPAAVADDLQLAVYHLAAGRDPDLVALGPPTQLRLLYLRTMHCYEQDVAADHESRTEARLLERAGRITAEEFQPSVDANCRRCSCQRLCPLHDEGRQLS